VRRRRRHNGLPGRRWRGDGGVGTVDERRSRLQNGRSERRRGVGGAVGTVERSASDKGGRRRARRGGRWRRRLDSDAVGTALSAGAFMAWAHVGA
jgi:hypothetical protein